MNARKLFAIGITFLVLLAVIVPVAYQYGKRTTSIASARNIPAPAYDAGAARDKAIEEAAAPAPAPAMRYDASAVRDQAVVLSNEVANHRPWVYDATAAMLKAITAPTPKRFPVYDATGVMLQNVVQP